MSGRLTHLALRAMDQAAKLVLRPPKQPEHLRTGQRGEELAYFYLRQMGYVIVARNYRSRRRRSEVDLVGWDGNVLCFLEVKTRTSREVKPAEAAVDHQKQGDLRGMAREYLRRYPCKPNPGFHPHQAQSAKTRRAGDPEAKAAPLGAVGVHPNEPKTAPLGAPGLRGTPGRVAGSPPYRFDILSIYILDGADPEFTLFKNAFPVA
jgi:putative endonuclease